MKNLVALLLFISTILTIAGTVYVIYTGGRASAFFALIPMLFTLVLSSTFNLLNKK